MTFAMHCIRTAVAVKITVTAAAAAAALLSETHIATSPWVAWTGTDAWTDLHTVIYACDGTQDH